MNLIKKLKVEFYNFINTIIPKKNQVIIDGGQKADANAVELANYIVENYNVPVYYKSNPFIEKYSDKVLNKKIKLVNAKTKDYKFLYLRTKYIFTTHAVIQKKVKNQIFTNLWHGVGHKKTFMKANNTAPAHYIIASSPLTQKIMADYFNTPIDSTIITGYPRNDLMLRVQKDYSNLDLSIKELKRKYKKIIIWLPTYRSEAEGFKFKYDENKLKFSDFFQVENFDVKKFNKILKENNTLCIMKPHPIYRIDNFKNENLENILVINDEWLYEKRCTLYHLMAVTDLCITDFSSVMTDYTLLNKPVLIFTTGFEEYKNNRGFYFKDVENYFPSDVIEDEELFFKLLNDILKFNADPFKEKRIKVRDLYFNHKDINSTKRICEAVFKNTKFTQEIR